MMAGTPPHYSHDLQKMYKSILHKQARCPSYFSRAARKLLAGLLQREPHRRLGSGDPSQLYSAPFFRSLNFSRVLARGYVPASSLPSPRPFAPATSRPLRSIARRLYVFDSSDTRS